MDSNDLISKICKSIVKLYYFRILNKMLVHDNKHEMAGVNSIPYAHGCGAFEMLQ